MADRLYEQGPLHPYREQIAELLATTVRTGDIIYQQPDVRGPFGIPFTKWVAEATESEYSHCGLIRRTQDGLQVVELNEKGTMQYPIEEWLSGCATPRFSVYRMKQEYLEVLPDVERNIERLLSADPDYDRTFDKPHKFYCTEAVCIIYRSSGIVICEPELLRQILKFWTYCLVRVMNPLFSLTGYSLPFDRRLYYVGNSRRGMLSSPHFNSVYEQIGPPQGDANQPAAEIHGNSSMKLEPNSTREPPLPY